MRVKQRIDYEAPLALKLHSATEYLEPIQELYQRKEAWLELVQLLQAVVSLLQEIRREVLLQELTALLHNEDLPEARRKEKVGKYFSSWLRRQAPSKMTVSQKAENFASILLSADSCRILIFLIL
jgi:hypothetical protein